VGDLPLARPIPTKQQHDPLQLRLGDFNEDLRILGIDALRAAVRMQLTPQDVVRFMLRASGTR
jgi:hypothetical protein